MPLSNENLRLLCCQTHKISWDCCAPAKLVKYLEAVGGFGNSLKIHFLALHIGPFIYQHKILGAIAEEGLEALHRIFNDNLKRICRSDIFERDKICLVNWAVNVLLSDKKK